MDNSYILSIDQSTSGSKVIIFDNKGKLVAIENKEHKQYYPKPGWVEHNPEEIFDNVLYLLKKVLEKSKIPHSKIKALSITNQRETVVVWDKITGKPVYNAIVWQCRRSSEICQSLKEHEKIIKGKTGLVLDPYFSASKIKWIFENIDGIKEKSEKNEIAIGTMDSWLIWKLTEGSVHATDYTNASRTMLFNLKELRWDEDLIKLFGVNKHTLPEIKSCNDHFGFIAPSFLGFELPISGVIGDSHGALFGQKCFEKGSIKATYGTGSSILMNIGEEFLESEKGLCTSLAWVYDKKPVYAFEGIIISSGDTLKWMKDNMGIINDFDDVEKALLNKNDNEGVYVVPAFVGLGIPYWKPDARAIITGMTRATDKDNIIRAGVESIAYQVNDAISTMKEESGIEIKEIKADGGPSKNNILMQFQSDISGNSVKINQFAESSALGSAYMAGLATGVWTSFDDLNVIESEEKKYLPEKSLEFVEKNIKGWKNAVKQVLNN